MAIQGYTGGRAKIEINWYPANMNKLWAYFGLMGMICSSVAQTTEPPNQEISEAVIRSGVREVVLDVVVRQKNQQLARRLAASDFKITEDGIPQKIKTFRFVSGKDSDPAPEVISTAPGAPAAPPRKMEEPSYVSIVFDQLSPGTRKYAQDAVHAFLTHELRSSTYVSIFLLDYRMSVLQNFTNDRVLLAQAVDRGIAGNYSSLSRDNASVINQADYSAVSNRAGVSIGSSIDLSTTPDLATAGAGTSIDEGAQAAAKIVSDQREIAMYQGGRRTVAALMNLVKYESSLPGRKTVLYLSEGMNLPPGQHELIRDVISTANRGHISFYGIDVRGLSPFSSNSLARNLSRTVAGVSASQVSSPVGVTTAQAKEADTQNEANVANNDQNMAELANGTGGFAVYDTNEIGNAMLRVMQDVRTHYEISYSPASEVFDGHFRQIQVTLDDPKLAVQSREGYYALPDLNGKSVLPFELAGLRALDSKIKASDFAFRVAALRYRPAQQGYRYEIAFEVPTVNITPRKDSETRKARLHAAFLALIKDEHGQVVDKVSHEIDQNVPDDKLDLFRQGRIIFTTPVELAPGHYTIEAAAIDPEGNRSSVRRTALVVGMSRPSTVSDISLVRDLQPLAAPRDPGDPLEFEGGRITPELDGTSKLAEGTSLYFVIYPGTGAAKPKVTVQFLRDGAPVATSQPDLSGPDEVNSIPVIASAKLPVGDYQAQVTVEQDGRAIRRFTAFSVAP